MASCSKAVFVLLAAPVIMKNRVMSSRRLSSAFVLGMLLTFGAYFTYHGSVARSPTVAELFQGVSGRPSRDAEQPGQQVSYPDWLQADKWEENRFLPMLRALGNSPVIPNDQVLRTYTLQQLCLVFHSFIDNIDIICKRNLRMGNVGHCGYEVCDDYEWRPIRPCIVYSFGINYEFSFDDGVARVYGCHVFSFDPSMKNDSYRRSERVMFYRIGIVGDGENHPGWKTLTFSQIKDMLNHTDLVIDVVKLDVEGSEWSSLSNMLQGTQLNKVRQLIVEYHLDAALERHRGIMLSRLAILRGLQEAGFRRFNVRKNEACARQSLAYPIDRTTCYEMHYVNTNFRRP